MNNPLELAKECEDADILSIFVSSTCFSFEFFKPCGWRGNILLELPRCLELSFKPEIDESAFLDRLQYEVFCLRNFFGQAYLLELFENKKLRLTKAIVGTMFSITTCDNVEASPASWEIKREFKEMPPFENLPTPYSALHYLEELEGMTLEKIDFHISSSSLYFRDELKERILYIATEIEFTGELLNNLKRLRTLFPEEFIGTAMSTLAGCIDSKVEKIEAINSEDLAITFDSGAKILAVRQDPPEEHFEESWVLQDAKTKQRLVVCDCEGF